MAKKAAVKTIRETIWNDNHQWSVRVGKLNPGRGRPESIQSLFKVVREKLPFEAINKVNAHLRSLGIRRNGVYIAHDSMGYARYIGRGRIFQRLRARKKSQELELRYFSFYVVEERKHGRNRNPANPRRRAAASIQHEEEKGDDKRR